MPLFIPPSDETREAGRYPQGRSRLPLSSTGAFFIALCLLSLALLVLALVGIRVF